MATSQQQLVCDSSTLANYKQWAQAVSNWMRSVGYTNTSDTGQLNGAGGGNGGTAGWTALAAAPGSAAFFYEIFQSNDAFTQFFVKLEYGNVSGANCPSLRISIGTGTNGTGTLTGFFTPALNTNVVSFTAPSTTTQYECNFSGDSNSRICVMMWRNGVNSCQQFFAIQRSLDSTGAATSSYVTVWTCGNDSQRFNQQTLIFGSGVGPQISGVGGGSRITGSPFRGISTGVSAFAGSIPVDNAAPCLGYWDNESTAVGTGRSGDITDGVTFTATVYGVTKTYMPGATGPFQFFGPGGTTGATLLMEYD